MVARRGGCGGVVGDAPYGRMVGRSVVGLGAGMGRSIAGGVALEGDKACAVRR